MINKENGYLEIAADLSIAPNDSLESIAKLKLGEVQQLRDMETGYKWLTLKNVVVKDEFSFLHFASLMTF